MLHKIILRISLTFTAMILMVVVPLNVYKQELLTFIITHALAKPVLIKEVEGFFPFELTAKTIEIDSVCRLENIDAALSFKTFATGHPQFKNLRIEKLILLQPKQEENKRTFDIPDLSFLKKLSIKSFETTIYKDNEQNCSLSLKGKLRDGVVFSKVKWKDYQAEIKLDENNIDVKAEIFGKELIFTGHRKDKSILWKGSFGKDLTCAGNLDQNGVLTLERFKTKVMVDHLLTLVAPVHLDLTKPLMLEEAKFSFLEEVLTFKNIAFQDELRGTLSAEFSKPIFWKMIHPSLDMEGKLSLKATISGTPGNPSSTFNLSSATLKHKSIKPLKMERFHLRGTLNDQRLTLTTEIDGKHSLKFIGTAEIDLRTNTIKGNLNTHLNLRNLRSMLPKKDRISGQMAGEIVFSGTFSAPIIEGKITLKDGYFENYIIGTHLTNLQGSLTLHQNIYQLEIHGKDDFKGTASVKGDGDILKGAGHINATLDRFYLGQSDLFTAQVSGNATVDLARKRVDGTLKAHRVIVDLDQLTPSSTPKIKLTDAKNPEITPVDNTQKEPNQFFLDLTMTPENNVIVRGFGIQSIWDGYMKLHGTNPDFVGEFNLKRGTIDILDRMMTLTRGHITFDHEIDKPHIDIDITKKIQDYKVMVNLQGRSIDPKFNFTSDPPLSQEEILGLILMGRKSAAGSIGQLVELSSSLSSLTNHGNENFFSKFRKAFGIEALEIKKLEQNSTSEAPQALSIRKQITPDFTLVIEQGLTSTEDETKSTRASIEANVTENVSVEVDVSSDKSGAVGLNWVKRY